MKTASRSSVKNATKKTAANSSLKSASKSSMKAAVNSHSIRPRVASAYKRNARARSAAATTANSYLHGSKPRFMKSAQAGPADNASR